MIKKPWLKYYSDEAINAILPEKTIYQYLYDSNVNNLNKIAINYFGKKVTYRSMFNFIDEISYALKSIGVGDGDIISLCMLTIDDNERKKLPERDIAMKLVYIDAIPLTSVGKVDYRALESM